MPVEYRIIAARLDFSKTDRQGPVRGNRFYNRLHKNAPGEIAGQIYGAWHGESALPVPWIEKFDINN